MESRLLFGHYRLLHHMKRVQRDNADLVCADLFSTCLYTANDPCGKPLIADLSRHWRYDLEAALLSLEEKDCIRRVGEDAGFPVYRITYDGRRRVQRAVADLCHFLLTSVLVPVLVSAATTLVTLFLTRLLGA